MRQVEKRIEDVEPGDVVVVVTVSRLHKVTGKPEALPQGGYRVPTEDGDLIFTGTEHGVIVLHPD